MKIYDFDAKFYDYARTWVALHPGLNADQVEEHYNEMMINWLNAPAKWLDGGKPGEYFNRYSEPKDLMKLLEEYFKRDIGLPEPLYSRIVALGEDCAEPLLRIASDADKSEALRGTAIALLRDIGSERPLPLYVDMVVRAEDIDDLSEMAAEVLSEADASVADALMDRYDEATEYGQMLILDICSNFPENSRIYDRLVAALRSHPDDCALYASLLGDLGDPRAIEPLKEMLGLTDLNYLDYIELRNAVEMLGGDPGEERAFDGDPDYEAMRNI